MACCPGLLFLVLDRLVCNWHPRHYYGAPPETPRGSSVSSFIYSPTTQIANTNVILVKTPAFNRSIGLPLVVYGGVYTTLIRCRCLPKGRMRMEDSAPSLFRMLSLNLASENDPLRTCRYENGTIHLLFSEAFYRVSC